MPVSPIRKLNSIWVHVHDIKNARKVRRVMKHGELYGMDVLMKEN